MGWTWKILQVKEITNRLHGKLASIFIVYSAQPFVEVCLAEDAKKEAEKYAVKVEDIWDKVEVCTQLMMFQEAMEAVYNVSLWAILYNSSTGSLFKWWESRAVVIH